MPDMDVVEQRLAMLGVNVYDTKQQDAYYRCVMLLDRCETKINNLTVELREAYERIAALEAIAGVEQ